MHTSGDLVFAVTALLTKKTCEWHKEEVSVVCGVVLWDLSLQQSKVHVHIPLS